MVDFTVIENEISALIGSTGFTSVETGRIREDIPITQMPSLDVAVTGHETLYRANKTYSTAVIAVIRNKGVDRSDNAATFKAFIKSICEALEEHQSVNIDAIRDISSDFGETRSGDGSFVRSAVLTIRILSH